MAQAAQYILALFCFGAGLRAQNAACDCDPARPETMAARQCSLCREAELQPAGAEFFLLKDINPRKPNRWLVLPRAHGKDNHPLHDLPADQRTRLWKFAIDAAKEHFGEEWAVAYNGGQVRTQCHLHIHVGRLIRAAENSQFIVIRRIEDIPVSAVEGVWIHSIGGGAMHVHTGEITTETALLR
jgi:diadenosine tetraphosphate (Ap4A) HIT family hydrolase